MAVLVYFAPRWIIHPSGRFFGEKHVWFGGEVSARVFADAALSACLLVARWVFLRVCGLRLRPVFGCVQLASTTK